MTRRASKDFYTCPDITITSQIQDTMSFQSPSSVSIATNPSRTWHPPSSAKESKYLNGNLPVSTNSSTTLFSPHYVSELSSASSMSPLRPVESINTLTSPTDDQSTVNNKISDIGLRLDRDGATVLWISTHADHPRNWSAWKKGYTLAVIYWLEFFMTLISTAGAPAAHVAGVEYGSSRILTYVAFISIYLIGQLLGGVICSPISETFGSRFLYIMSAVVYAGFSLFIPLVPSFSAVFIGRFITGFVAAVPAVVAFGTIEDIFGSESRIWIIYSYNLLANAALTFGPIYGIYIAETIGWEWIFYISAITIGIGAVAAFFMSESRAPVLLEKKLQSVRNVKGCQDLKGPTISRTDFNLYAWALESLFRPLYFLVSQPIVFFCAALISIAYCLIYGLAEAIPIVFLDFGWTHANTSLAFLAVLFGMVLSVIPRFFEKDVFKRHHEAVEADPNTPSLKPEAKIRSFALSAPAMAIGLWVFAWTIPPLVHIHWAVSMIGLVMFGYAANDFDCILFSYITDCYGEYTASAVSAITICRSILAAAMPLFTTNMFKGMGSNYATTVLAGLATLFAFTPILFFGFAKRLRKASAYTIDYETNEVVDEESLPESVTVNIEVKG